MCGVTLDLPESPLAPRPTSNDAAMVMAAARNHRQRTERPGTVAWHPPGVGKRKPESRFQFRFFFVFCLIIIGGWNKR